jgi:hypothetical protein
VLHFGYNSLGHSRPEEVPVAQLDRASASGAEGYRFDSCRGYFNPQKHRENEAFGPTQRTTQRNSGNFDPDLQRIIDRWPGLPEPIRAAMLALVASACPAHKAS